MYKYLLLIILQFLFFTGCKSASPPGIVASVNGELISLHSVQALLDSRSASLGISARPSVSEMQKNYSHALSILITHTLVRQDLAGRGMSLSDSEIEAAIESVREDFGNATIAEYLAEDFLREEDWRDLFRDQLAIDTFMNRVILPTVHISLEEIREWYETHKEDFKIPESYHICYGAAYTREALLEWCGRFGEEDFYARSQCQYTAPDLVPQPWQAEMKKAAPGTCAKPVEFEEMWRTAVLVNKEAGRVPPLSEVYALVENILVEQKKLDAFNKWLEAKLATSSIQVHPRLFASDEKAE